MLALVADGVDLLGGRSLRQDPVNADRGAHGSSHVRVVARHHHDPADARTAERSDHPWRIGPDRVVDDDRARHIVIHADEHARRPVEHRSSAHVARPCGQVDVAGHVVRLAERDPAAVHHPADPGPVRLLDVVRERQPAAAHTRRPSDRVREDMRGHLIERGGQTQEVAALHLRERLHVDHFGRARRQRPGLVEEQGVGPAERLEGAAALDDHATLRGAGDPGDDRDRHREDQWARGGHHQNRQRARRVAAHRPRRPGQHQRHRDEPQRVTVGEPDRRRLLPLRLLDEPNDACIRGVLGRGGRTQVEGRAGVHGPRSHPVGGRALHRPRLARERGLVRHGRRDGDAIDGDDLAGLHHQHVADLDLADRPLLEPAVLVAAHPLRRAADEIGELPTSPALGERLERLPGREHQRDDGAGQVLTKRERSRDREEGDHVDACLAAQDPPHDADREWDAAQERRRDPADVRGAVAVAGSQREPREQRHGRTDEPQPVEGEAPPDHDARWSRPRRWMVIAVRSVAISTS